MGQENIWFWLGFLAFVAVLLAIDLGVLNRKAHAVSLKEAALLSVVWISIALLFGVLVTVVLGSRAGVEYYTAWVLEKSLSVDNLFVFVLIFSFFRVPAMYHHRVLFWGILGAIAMRAVLIVAGTSLIQQFSWLMIVFGAFLIYTGIKLGRSGEDDKPEIDNNPLLKLARRFLRITPEYHGEKFFVRMPDLVLYATPLLLVLIVIESTDLVFAVDSIPAVIGVSHDPFVIFTSNVMAILGLRALYFLLAGAVDRFHYLKPALAIILTFVGVKMIVEQLFHLGEFENLMVLGSLIFILSVLAIAIVASFVRERRQPREQVEAELSHSVK